MTTQTVNLEFEITKQDVISGTKNYVCSQKYIERIVKASVVNILFQRLPIPENIFVTKEFNSIPYRAFKMDCIGSGIAQLYRKWIKGFQDSFRKKYLKEFILFFSDNSQTVQENFKFKFVYEERIDVDKACTDLTEPTESMLKSLIALGEMPKLHKNVSMHVELFYYEGTPSDYKPPLFDSKDYMSTLRSKMEGKRYESTVLGRINTGFHYFVFSCKRKVNESQLLQDSQKGNEAKKRRKSRSINVERKISFGNIDSYASDILAETRREWNNSDRDLKSPTSIDLISETQSRAGISFDMDFRELPNDDDIDMIADVVSPRA